MDHIRLQATKSIGRLSLIESFFQEPGALLCSGFCICEKPLLLLRFSKGWVTDERLWS